MARKPNYAYAKDARARAKAAKREAKRQSKMASRNGDAGAPAEAEEDMPDSDVRTTNSAD